MKKTTNHPTQLKGQSVEVKEETEERFGKIYAKGSAPILGKIVSFFASGEKKSEEEYRNRFFMVDSIGVKMETSVKKVILERKTSWLECDVGKRGQKLFEINSNNEEEMD